MSRPLKLSLTRRYRFAASHRLHRPNFSDDENQRIYGKCSSPYGHGHNYSLEVTVSGAVDPATGMVANLGDLDPFVEREVVEAFDHKYLNEEVQEFVGGCADSREYLPGDLSPVEDVSRRRASNACGLRRRARTALNSMGKSASWSNARHEEQDNHE